MIDGYPADPTRRATQPRSPAPNECNLVDPGNRGRGHHRHVSLRFDSRRPFYSPSQVSQLGRKVAIETPVASISVNGDNPHATGLEIYPGATPSSNNKNASIDLSANDSSVGIATEEYQTKDPIDFVQAWYKKHLGSDFRLETGDEKAAHARGSVSLNDSDVAFVDDRHSGARVVALKKIPSGTQITLVRVGKKETQ